MINLISAVKKGLKSKKEDYAWNIGRLHASDTSVYLDGNDGKCELELWLRYRGYLRKPNKPGELLMFDQGHNLEEKVIGYLRRGLPDGFKIVAEQMNISAGLPGNITGRLDILISDGESLSVIDVKSQRGASFRYMSDEPKPMHKMQVNTYLYSLENMFSMKIKNGGILVVDREGQNFVQDFWWQYTDEDRENVKNALEYIQEIVADDNPPQMLKPKIKINHNKGNDSVKVDLPWQCKYCNYREITCGGAVPPKYDDYLGRVCGHIIDDKFQEKYEGIGKYVNLDEVN